MKGLTSIVLGINMAVFTPDYLHAQNINLGRSYPAAAQSYTESNPKPAPQHMVAYSIYNLTLEARIGNVNIPMDFYVQVHSLKPKNDEVAILHNASDLYRFLQNNEYDQIFIFKMLKSGIHHGKPSVVIDKNEMTAYYSLEGEDNMVNYLIRFEHGFDNVQPKLIEGIVAYIFSLQGVINLKRKGIILPQVLKVTGIES
ncbi:hypothetical protein J4480_06765 [Candidatus Woesearchaeota archaeon]|nr:hypothetical protein [Candidatus Woesearchaeota archaeon]